MQTKRERWSASGIDALILSCLGLMNEIDSEEKMDAVGPSKNAPTFINADGKSNHVSEEANYE